jgi:radical SAM protein with 4Fe4S-binding SPASM domain
MQSTIVTGERGLDAERAQAAARAGVQSVAVSIDGAPETHDRLRGLRGSHAAAVTALRVCREAGMQVAVNTQVSRLNLPELPAILALLLEVKAHGWQVQLTVPAGRAADEPDVILQPYDLLALFPLLAECKRRCDQAGVKLLCGNNIGYFGPFEHLLRSHQPCGHADSCSAGRATLGIEANGDIKGCPSLPSDAWVGGNIREHSLRGIWERAQPLRYTRDRTVADLWGHCRTCYYADECRAGCTWMTTALFGLPGNNPYCHHRALDFDRRGLRERVQRVAEAPGLPFDHGRWELIVEPAGGARPLHPSPETTP